MAKKSGGSRSSAASKRSGNSGAGKGGAKSIGAKSSGKKAAAKKPAVKKAASRSGAKSAAGKSAPGRSASKSAPAKKGAATKKAAPKRAKSKGSTSEHGSHTTTDHQQIQNWVEQRGGYPAAVRRTEHDADPGLLRIEFSEAAESSLEKIEWNEFFEKFDEKNLAFLYQEQTVAGEESRFNKFVDRANMEGEGGKKAQSRRGSSGGNRRK
ncbi:MAG: hypothetical protein NVSMB14_18190 [Isosphaeraceae bacterium]